MCNFAFELTNMKERLKEFLLEKDLNAKLFALKIGVQPSSISHILTGRNKPSVELLEKLIKSFPDADVKYLISGIKSEISRQITPVSGPSDEVSNVENELTTPHESIKQDTDVTLSTDGEKVIILHSDGTFSKYSSR